MSRTKRKNLDKIEGKRGLPPFALEYPPEPDWKKTRDKKPWHKPGKKAKEFLKKDRPKSTKKIDLGADFDNLNLPSNKKTDVWYYN